MKSAYVTLIIAILFITNSINPQNKICGTSTPTNLVMPNYLSTLSTKITVPIVFHVIMGSDNSGDVLDNQLTQQIDVLNNCFSGTDYSFIFYLSGINRVKNNNWRDLAVGTTAVTNMVNELAIDPKHVLNIYITSTYPSYQLGWLIDWMWNLPENSPQNGIVIKTDCLPGGNYTNYNSGISCAHEVGHYMGLYHTFDDLNKCNYNDLVADTPVHNMNSKCPPENTDTCPNKEGLDPIHNYMNYTYDNCRTEFTKGQRDRMSFMVSEYRPNLNKNTINFTASRTIKNGDSWKIYNGTYKFAQGSQIVVNGTLNAVGSSTNKITFTIDGSGNWGGIHFNSGSGGTLDNCDISYATIGVKTYNSSPQIYRTNIDNCETGVYCDYYSSPNLYYSNIRFSNSYGVYCYVYSSPNFLGGGSYSGYNVIKNNNTGNYGIYAIYNCNPVLGNSWYGQNSIYGHTGPEVGAAYNCNVAAKNNWWGSATPSSSEFSASSSTIDYIPYLAAEPSQNQGRSILPSNKNDKYAPPLSIMSAEEDELNLAEEKQKEGKYDEAINLFLEVFKKEKENSKGRYALIKIEECFTQAGKKDFLDFSKKELKPLIKEENELYVVLLELETHQLYNVGYKDYAMNNLKTILKKYNYNTEIEKQTLYRIGAFYLDLFNDTLNAVKTFDELAEKYPDDELLTYANMLLNEERYNKPNAKKVEQLTETAEAEEEFLSNNPNPFNPATIINYRVPENSLVTIKVYDVLGKEVTELVNEEKISGSYSVTFNASNLSSGIYFYTINAGKYSAVKKMLLIK